MNILLTGGLGYIGSHTATVLCEQGHEVVVLDNLVNSDRGVLKSIELITGKSISFIEADICDTGQLEDVLIRYEINAVIHFAGLKAVGESVSYPLDYYNTNVRGTISLLQGMQNQGVRTLIFSSSATVYGEPQYLPLDEEHSTLPASPYGRTKLYIEGVLADLAASDSDWRIAALRYFNPVGAHDSGLIGERPKGLPNNLMPYIIQVAAGLHQELHVFGDCYPTVDGTGVRDYIHVMDLAEGHVAAVNYIQNKHGFSLFNLGTGKGTSVLELIDAFENATKQNIRFTVTQPRSGDIASSFANPAKAMQQLKWMPKRGIAEMCFSSWKFQHLNMK
jgi:UDP-glucose 4-epimerase